MVLFLLGPRIIEFKIRRGVGMFTLEDVDTSAGCVVACVRCLKWRETMLMPHMYCIKTLLEDVDIRDML